MNYGLDALCGDVFGGMTGTVGMLPIGLTCGAASSLGPIHCLRLNRSANPYIIRLPLGGAACYRPCPRMEETARNV